MLRPRSRSRRSSRTLRSLIRGNFESLEPRLVLDSTVVFNEIMYHPADGGTSEFIELHNQHAVDLDLSQWRLDGGIEFTFPEGTVISGGGYLVVAKDPVALGIATGFASALGPFQGQLDDGGETVELRDRNDRLMDTISYSDGGNWTALPDGTGVSLAKLNQNTNSDDAARWGSSVQIGGTPGLGNFPDAFLDRDAVPLVTSNTPWKYDASNSLPASDWFGTDYNDSSWTVGDQLFYIGPPELSSPNLEVVTGIVATPSSNLAGFDRLATYAVNGAGLVGDTHVIAPDGNMWLNQGTFAAPNDLAPEITFDLGSVREIDHMRFWNYNEDISGRPELLGRGIRFADILVAGDNGVFTTLIPNYEFRKAPGTQTDFSEIIDFGGIEARFVKLDISGNWGGDASFVGISEVQFIAAKQNFSTELPSGSATHYFRTEFDFPFPPDIVDLQLDLAVDDGAVVYLNGQEIYRTNMPTGPVSHATLASSPIGTTDWVRGIAVSGVVVEGRNVLAVETHQATAINDADLVFGAELMALAVRPGDPAAVTLIELESPWRYNTEGEDLGTAWRETTYNPDPSATQLAFSTPSPAPFYGGDVTPIGTGSAALAGVTASASTEFSSGADQRLAQFTVNGSGLTGTAHVATPVAGTMWLSRGTAAGANDIDPEITFDLGRVHELTMMKVWNFNQTNGTIYGVRLADILVAGEDEVFTTLIDNQSFDRAPGTNTDFSQDIDLGGVHARYVKIDIDTTSGVANHGGLLSLVGLSEVQFFANTPPGNTELPTGVTTQYFRKEFTFAGDPDRTTLYLNTIVDDGAVFYLNGVEVYRHNMAAGAPGYMTFSGSAIADPEFIGEIEIPSAALVPGQNVLAVELHQSAAEDSDLYFDATLRAVIFPPAPVEFELVPLQINEIAGSTDAGFFVEIINDGQTSQSLAGMVVASTGDDVFTIPNQTLEPGEILSIPESTLGFRPVTGQRLYLRSSDAQVVIDGVRVRNRPQGRADELDGEFSVEDFATPGDPNTITFDNRIVINEIMYNHRPDQTPSYAENPEEWVELYNRSASPVDLTGWQFNQAIDYTFPAGTTIAGNGYLVIAKDAAALRAKHPDIAAIVLGDYSGQLNNQTDRLELADANGKRADLVRYFEGGQWPEAADGGGSSLELRDADADNSVGLAWAASDESEASPWGTYTYTGVAAPSSIGPDGQWQEFLMGMLDSGEILLDDISVVQRPNSAPIQLIQNGSFEADTVGSEANTWRIIGNHRHSEVIVDPDDPTNHVLRFVATGTTEHMHNHAETTLRSSTGLVSIANGVEYQISFRAKWISGSNLLHTRLYFNRLAQVTAIDQPPTHGTPGRVNSTAESNIGPTYADMLHSPAVPAPNEDVTITVDAFDPDGVQNMTVWYSVNSGPWQSQAMTQSGGGQYAATIPGQSASTIVQFYVEGSDNAGITSVFPRGGADSRALLKVNDGKASDTGVHNFRMIVTPADADFMHQEIELMSNDITGATVIYDENEIYYDMGIRLSGSQRARPYQPRLGFIAKFDADQLFRGVYNSITLDRSESTGFGQREIIYHHALGRVGGLTSEYNDLFNIITPRAEHTGTAEAQLSRFSDVFLDEQFENGSDGQLYEYELTYYPTSTINGTAEGRKRPQPDGTDAQAVATNAGSNEENYRWAYLLKNNRAEDDFSSLVGFTQAMSLTGNAFLNTIGDYIDVDQWLRAFAFGQASGYGDNYTADGSAHNVQFYVRPSDGKVVQFIHDLDAFFQTGRSIVANSDLVKLIASPANHHMYLGHMHDMLETTFNQQYMERWTTGFGELLPAQNFTSHLNELVARANNVRSQINSRAPFVNFSIATNDFSTDSNTATITGRGWVNVREIRLAGSEAPLPVNWTAVTTYALDVPLGAGTNAITLEAYDFQGNKIASDTVTITSTATNSVSDSLRITEINYNPTDPTAAELSVAPGISSGDFEFLEFHNIGSSAINLLGTNMTNGISYTFPSFILAPGERTVVVQNTDAFTARYGAGIRIAGEFASGNLANGGEQLTLANSSGNVILDFSYADGDPWPVTADGTGNTLALIDPATSPDNYSDQSAWRASYSYLGTPGAEDIEPQSVVVNEILANSDASKAQLDSVELLNTSTAPIDISGWYLSDAGSNLLKFMIPEGTVLPAGAFVVFDESHFNPTPLNPGPSDFALSGSGGDNVYLTQVDESGQIISIVDDVHFQPSQYGVTLGRVNGSNGRLAPQGRITLGYPNAPPQSAAVVISEIMFAPPLPSAAALQLDSTLTQDDLEYLELTIVSSADVDLNQWHIRGGIDFDFATSSTYSNGDTILILPFDPSSPDNAARVAAFRAHYNLPTDRILTGGYAGQLSNRGEVVRLERLVTPPPSDPDATSYATADEVLYGVGNAWPTGTQESGNSLTRRSATFHANTPASWLSAAASPGTANFIASQTGDFTGDGLVTSIDIDAIYDAKRYDASLNSFDLAGDPTISQSDVDFLVRNILGTEYGDINLDGSVDTLDFNTWSANRFAARGNSWSTGDVTGDGFVDVRDFNQWYANRFASPAQTKAATSLPSRVPRAAIVSLPAIDAAFRDF